MQTAADNNATDSEGSQVTITKPCMCKIEKC